ncbi:MAG TPA: sulfite oxidase [Actinomycetota bacterium]
MAGPGDGYRTEEVRLAARNHGMPLEALREEITPAGLHYLLIHFDIPHVDPGTWRLDVGGLVRNPLRLSLEDLASRSTQTAAVTLECAGNGRAELEPRPVSQPWGHEAVGTARWTGVPLGEVLADAGVDDEAVEVLFTGLDRGIDGGEEQDYERSLAFAEAMRPEVLLAWEMNGRPLPPQHGFPLRLVVPGWYGMTHVKWLRRITVLDRPFQGYQQAHAYRLRSSDDEPGTPLTRILPRSLMEPPGIPEFLSRQRHLDAGSHTLRGRAWSGWAPVGRVEVSTDGGRSWSDAVLEPAPGPYAWRGWTFAWDAGAGEHELCSRATDEAGNVQPLDATWNLGGYANNSVQRLRVVVREA